LVDIGRIGRQYLDIESACGSGKFRELCDGSAVGGHGNVRWRQWW
jgi:hypothetical protein